MNTVYTDDYKRGYIDALAYALKRVKDAKRTISRAFKLLECTIGFKKDLMEADDDDYGSAPAGKEASNG